MKKLMTNFKLTFKRTLIALLSSAVLFSACSDEDDDPVVFVVDEDDAAEVVAVVLSVNTYGFASAAARFSQDVADYLSCGVQEQNAGTIDDTSNDGTVSYNYVYDETYSYSCDTEGGTVNYSFIAEQALTTLRYDTDSDISGIWAVTDIDNSQPSYNLAGVYETHSERDSKTDESPAAFFTVDLNYSDLKVDKSSGDLVGGSSQFKVSGRQIDTEGEDFEGTIYFDDPEATKVEFTDGGTYILNMRTGEINQIS